MSTSITRPWKPLTAENIALVPACVGVFEIGGETGIVAIGYAGGRSVFGLRGELADWLERGSGLSFRYERTNSYLSRFRELARVSTQESGVPPDNLARTTVE